MALKWQILPTSFPVIIAPKHVMWTGIFFFFFFRSNGGIIKRQPGEMLSGPNWPHKNLHIKADLIKVEHGKRKLEIASPKIGWESD